MRRFFGLSISAMLFPCAAFGQGLADSVRMQVDRVFASWDHTDTPGCALGISDHGRQVYARGYGMSDLQHGLAITPLSIFHVASISKQFAAFAVGLLADDGKLSLDDDVRKYVPEIPDYGVRITIRQLIHHISGLRDQWQLLGYSGWREDDLITEQDVLDIVSRQKGLNFSPGAEWVYSNTGYTLLAVITKRVSGQSLREFAQHRIFEPLGMSNTHFHDDHTMIVPNRTSAYQPRPEGKGWAISIPVFDTYGATSLFTTAGDLLKWMSQLDAPKVGSAKLLQEAQTSAVLNDGTPTNYGFGLSIGRYRGQRVVGHGGADAGYRAQVDRYPDRGIAIAVLCNASNSGPGALARRVADALLGSAPLEQVTMDTVRRTVSDQVRDRWVGTYRDTVSHLVLRIARKGDTVALGDGRLIFFSSDTSAFVRGGGQGFLLRSANGRVTGITQVPKSTRSVEWRRENTYAPDKNALAEFGGSYVSDELDVTYHVAVTDSGLVVRAKRIDAITLQPAWTDAFSTSFDTMLEFTRSGRKVDGFTISDGRARGIRFARVIATPSVRH
ncbi:MAG: serine hydrolase domain-containing protein [Gemmatimonadaceae bacterium]